MKLKKTILLATIILLSLSHTVFGGDRAINGLILGGGSGALMGQAIGRNSESTIIGATVGGILGYIIGNNTRSPAHGGYMPETMRSGNGYHHNGHRPRLKNKRYQSDHRPGRSGRGRSSYVRNHRIRKPSLQRDMSHGFENRRYKKKHDRFYHR